jgi:hypothetical protein
MTDLDTLAKRLNDITAEIDKQLRHRVTIESHDGDGYDDADYEDVSNPSLEADDDSDEPDDHNYNELPDDDEDDLGKRSINEYLREHDSANRPGALEHSTHHSGGHTTTAAVRAAAPHKFDALVSHIQERDNCSRALALSRARQEHPDAYRAYQDFVASSPDSEQYSRRLIGKRGPLTYEDLCQIEMRKGVNAEVAAQRIAQAHGFRALDYRSLSKAAASSILAEDALLKTANDIWSDDPTASRTDALRQARLASPSSYRRMQR